MVSKPISDIFLNVPLWTAVTAMLTAQCLKVLFEYRRSKSWQKALFLSPGGMPSSHTALAVALMASIGLRSGFNNTDFSISVVLMLVVMYDAAGVRRAAGTQAEAINYMLSKLEDQGVKFDKQLKELLGHTPIEVAAGALLGVIIALISYALF